MGYFPWLDLLPGLGPLEALDPRQCGRRRRAFERLRGKHRGAALPGRGAAGAAPRKRKGGQGWGETGIDLDRKHISVYIYIYHLYIIHIYIYQLYHAISNIRMI